MALRVSAQDFGIIHLLPSLSIDHVLYLPRSPFNLLIISRLTHFLICVLSFMKDFLSLQDR